MQQSQTSCGMALSIRKLILKAGCKIKKRGLENTYYAFMNLKQGADTDHIEVQQEHKSVSLTYMGGFLKVRYYAF